MKIYDRTNIPDEEKIFIKNVLNEINALKKNNHKHTTSLVLEFNNIKKDGVMFSINGTMREISQNKSFLVKGGITEPVASKLVLQVILCAPDVVWNACEIKRISKEACMIAMTGKLFNQHVNMVSLAGKREVTTEVNQLIVNDVGPQRVCTRIISELSGGVMEVEELISSLENNNVLYNRHSFLDIPSIKTKISIIEKYEDETKKSVFYEKNYDTPQAKGYDLLYDNKHALPENALRYVMLGNFNSIAHPPNFLKDTVIGRKFLERRKKLSCGTVIEQINKKPVSQKKLSSGALEIDKLLMKAKDSMKKR